MEFDNHKMRVKLAAQALSKSVADAIVFCREDLKLPDFKGSEGTTAFIYKLDKMFDLLNSKSPGQRGPKSPLNLHNFEFRSSFCDEFFDMVFGMDYTETRYYKKTGKTVETVKQLCQGGRKRAALGIVVSAMSIREIARSLLYREESPFRYIMTYRFSQDLLELFFNTVRGRLGRNNNPTTLDFQNIIKVIWHVSSLKSTKTGNCIAQAVDEILPGGLLQLKPSKKLVPFDSQQMLELDCIDLSAGLDSHYSDFVKNCIAYISGNVVRVVGTRSKCEKCAETLLDTGEDALPESLKRLIVRKDRGGLFVPCHSVYKIVEKTDVIFRRVVAESKGSMNICLLDKKICNLLLNDFVGSNLFPHSSDHFAEFNLSQFSHFTKIVSQIIHHYLKIRLFDHGRRYEAFKEISSRHKLSKLTLFKNQ